MKGLGSGKIVTTGGPSLPAPTTSGKPLRTTFGTRVYKGRGASR